jgi:hypothetical protein
LLDDGHEGGKTYALIFEVFLQTERRGALSRTFINCQLYGTAPLLRAAPCASLR